MPRLAVERYCGWDKEKELSIYSPPPTLRSELSSSPANKQHMIRWMSPSSLIPQSCRLPGVLLWDCKIGQPINSLVQSHCYPKAHTGFYSLPVCSIEKGRYLQGLVRDWSRNCFGLFPDFPGIPDQTENTFYSTIKSKSLTCILKD